MSHFPGVKHGRFENSCTCKRRGCDRGRLLIRKLNRDSVWNDACVVCFIEEHAHCFAPILPVVESAGVDVHRNILICIPSYPFQPSPPACTRAYWGYGAVNWTLDRVGARAIAAAGVKVPQTAHLDRVRMRRNGIALAAYIILPSLMVGRDSGLH